MALKWRRRHRVEKHGGRWAVEWGRRTWASAAGWEVRWPWSDGGGSMLRNNEGGGLWSGRGGRGCRWRAGRCGGRGVEVAAAR